MKLYTAVKQTYHRPVASVAARPASIFLAGGIKGCPDWQAYAVNRLKHTQFVVLNPRRPEFSPSEEEGRAQIRWERFHLEQADEVLFWFPQETVCPISLFELGTWLYTRKVLLVGCHPKYPKRFDVQVQSRLARPEMDLADDLDKLLDTLCQWDEDRRWLKKHNTQENRVTVSWRRKCNKPAPSR